MKIQPLQDRVIVKRLEEDTKTAVRTLYKEFFGQSGPP